MKILFFLMVIIISSPIFGQGLLDGFRKQKGTIEVGLSGFYDKGTKYYAGPKLVPAYRKTQIASLYMGYGVTKRLSFAGNVPYINFNSGTEENFQDASLAVKYLIGMIKLKDSDKKRSIDFFIGTSGMHPISDYKIEGGDAIGQQAKVIEGVFIAQYNAPGWFFSAQTGYTYRSEPTPSSVPFSIKYGWYKGKIYTDVWLATQYAFGGKDYQGRGSLRPSTFKELGVSYAKIGGTFYYSINPKFGGFVNLTKVLHGRNTTNSFGIGLGVIFKLIFSK